MPEVNAGGKESGIRLRNGSQTLTTVLGIVITALLTFQLFAMQNVMEANRAQDTKISGLEQKAVANEQRVIALEKQNDAQREEINRLRDVGRR